jgi:hypothetical protein
MSLTEEQGWQNDPAEKELLSERSKLGTFRTYAVEGVDNSQKSP